MQNKPRGAKLDLNTRHLAPFVEALWARHPFLLLVEEESVMRPKSICVRHPSEEIAWGNVQTITLVAQRLKFDCHLAEYSVKIVDPQYGMFTWPAAPVLAQFIWQNREQVKGKQVIEIGAGTSLPGIVASLCGAHVTLTDKEEYPECLKNCQQSCDANGQDSVKVLGITWGQFTPNLFRLPKADIILGSDCFYDTKDFDDILATISFLMEKNVKAKFWTTYQERSSSRSIEDLLKKWGLQGVKIPLEEFNADKGNIGGSDLSDLHTIHMLEITSQQDLQAENS